MENLDSSFSFQQVRKDKITKTMEKLDPKKSFRGFFSDYIY